MAGSADILSGLHDIRLPEASETLVVANAAAAFSVGLAAALLLALLVRVVARRRQSRREAALAGLAETRGLEPAKRLLAQATLLQRLAGEPGPDDAAPPGRRPAGGRHWTARLDRRLGTDFFTAGAGADLRKALYRREVSVDPDDMEWELTRLLQRIKG